MNKLLKVCVIGGGTGTVAVLHALKQINENLQTEQGSLEISVIVSMTDDGGSNAIVRDEFGLLPLSDLRKSIIALADENSSPILRNLFTYRFAKGLGLSSHTLGNLMMMALADVYGGENEAIKKSCELFNVVGNIIPVTYDHVTLVAEYENGATVTGEHLIDEPEISAQWGSKIVELKLDTKANANPLAVKALGEADFIIAGPGDLYTSTLANVIIPGIAESISKNRGKLIFITNLMTKKGQTHWMKASDFIGEMSRYTSRNADYILQNNSAIPDNILTKYQEDGEKVLIDDLGMNVEYNSTTKIIRSDLIGSEVLSQQGDTLKRSLIRHDVEKLVPILTKVIMGYEHS